MIYLAGQLDETSYIFSLICRGLIHQTRQFSGFINEVATKDAQLFMSFHIDDRKFRSLLCKLFLAVIR